MGDYMGCKLSPFFLLSLLLIVSFIPLVYASIFSDGFESGDFSAWTGTNGAPTVQDVIKHCGTYAMYTNDSGEYAYKTFAAEAVLYSRIYVYFDSLTAQVTYDGFLETRSATGLIARLAVAGTNQHLQLQYYIDAGVQTDASATTVSLDTWHCIELYGKIDASAGEYKVYLDDVEVADLTHLGLANDNRGSINQVRVGTSGAFRTAQDYYFDCIVVDTSYIGVEAEGQDLTFPLFENFNVWDSTTKTIETSHTLSQSFNSWESMAFNKEIGFKLYEPFNLWSYLASSKEQSFTFFQPFNLWSSLTMASEGVALDLYFTLFEAFNPIASLGTVLEEELTLNDVYGLAALAFILAIVGICLAVAFKKK